MKKFFNSTVLTLAISSVLMVSAFATAFAAPANTTSHTPESSIETEANTNVETEVDTSIETEAEASIETEANTSIETEADTTVETEAEASIETEANTSIETEADTNVETEADTTVETEADTSIETETEANTNVETEANTNVETDSTVETEHHCAIVKANANYHRYSCDECENFSTIYHNEDYMSVCEENEFFHNWSCDCGYGYAETHTFRTSYNTTGHYDVCIDCGYATELVSHVWEDDFWSDYHDTQCAECGYVLSRHIGVDYICVDDTTCQATCRECSMVAEIPHDWDGFVCDGCNHIVSGGTYTIVKRIYETDDGYRVRFIDNGGSHNIDMWDVEGFEEGDFVKIDHYGNNIFDITVVVDGDIVNDAENFSAYISDSIIEKSEDRAFEDLVIRKIYYNNDYVYITFESETRFMQVNPDIYVVYDLTEGEMSELEDNYAYLTMYDGTTVYFICFW